MSLTLPSILAYAPGPGHYRALSIWKLYHQASPGPGPGSSDSRAEAAQKHRPYLWLHGAGALALFSLVLLVVVVGCHVFHATSPAASDVHWPTLFFIFYTLRVFWQDRWVGWILPIKVSTLASEIGTCWVSYRLDLYWWLWWKKGIWGLIPPIKVWLYHRKLLPGNLLIYCTCIDDYGGMRV